MLYDGDGDGDGEFGRSRLDSRDNLGFGDRCALFIAVSRHPVIKILSEVSSVKVWSRLLLRSVDGLVVAGVRVCMTVL